jgi:hypothetical protein
MIPDAATRAEREARDAGAARASVERARELVDRFARENDALHVLLVDAAGTLLAIRKMADRNHRLAEISDAAEECLKRISNGGPDA